MKQATPVAVALISTALVLLSGAGFARKLRSDVEKDGDFEVQNGPDPKFAIELAPNVTAGDDSDLYSVRSKRADIPANCQWSACEGLTILGQIICNRHGAGYVYVGYTKKDDCSWDTSRSECCKAGSNRRWTKKCWGSGYQAAYACQSEFGHGVVQTGNTKSCSGIAMTQYECGN